MKKSLQISDNLSLPLDWITLATVVYGARGSGKTTLGRVMAEEVTKAKQRFCAIDLKGDWYGLKSSSDGKSSAIPVVIFGGDHADVPLEDAAGAFIGETVAELGQSCVLDLEHLSKGKQVRFLADFFERLYDKNRDPLLLLLDEAQRYAPQSGGRGMDPQIQRCLGAVEDVVKLGRKHGIGPVLFTQRGSGLNKEVSELCDLLVAFRTPGPLDQDRIKDWLDANTTRAQRDDVMGKLAGLPTGTAVFASGHPDLKLFGVHAVRRSETYDSSATPKVGERRKEPKALAQADLTALREKMAATIERAKQEDPKELRKRIRELEARVAEAVRDETRDAARIAELSAETKTKAAEVPSKDLAALERIVSKLAPVIDLAASLVNDLDTAAGKINESIKARRLAQSPALGPLLLGTDAGRRTRVFAANHGKREPSPFYPLNEQHVTHISKSAARAERTAARQTNGQSSELGNSGARRMLVALCQSRAPITPSQLAIRSNIARRGGTFRTYLGKLITEGFAVRVGERLEPTDRGREAPVGYELLPTGAALLNHWISELGTGGASKMLRAIGAAHPASLTREELGAATGIAVSGGTFRTYLGKLKTLELVVGKDELKLSEGLVG